MEVEQAGDGFVMRVDKREMRMVISAIIETVNSNPSDESLNYALGWERAEVYDFAGALADCYRAAPPD